MVTKIYTCKYCQRKFDTQQGWAGHEWTHEPRYKDWIPKRNTIISKCNTGEGNGQWKGHDVKYNALHDYIKYHLSKSDFCNNCKTKPPYDLANISGEYKRDLNDWEWLCRKCHMIKDGRLEKLKSYQHIAGVLGAKKRWENYYKQRGIAYARISK